MSPEKTVAILIGIVIAIGAGVLIGLNSYVTIDTGHVGILKVWGAADLTKVLPEGFNQKCPIGCEVIQMNVQTQTYRYPDLGASTSDLQTVTTSISVILHPKAHEMNKILKEQGNDYVDKVVSSQIPNLVKESTALFTIDKLVTDREAVRAVMFDKLTNIANPYGIVIEQVNIDNIVPPSTYVDAANQKKVSEQQAETARNNVVVAKFEAEKIVTEAKGRADARAAEADGEARYIKTINDAMESNEKYVEWFKVNRWDGRQPMVVGDGAVPLVSINP